MRISLIGTTHAERGLANTGELLAILERCKPEVIFAEIPATHAERYANASHATLESIAVARYLASNQAEVVPVDLAEPEEKFFDDSKEMFTAVERRSPKYRSLVDRNTDEVRAGGFRYLNSDQCMQAWEDIYREVLETIEWIGDRRLREIYDLWSHVNESRDRDDAEYCALLRSQRWGTWSIPCWCCTPEVHHRQGFRGKRNRIASNRVGPWRLSLIGNRPTTS